MKDSRKQKRSTSSSVTASKGAAAGRFLSMVESRFQEFPQIEAILLQGVGIACRTVIEFLNDLEGQISEKVEGIKGYSTSNREAGRNESTSIQ